MAEDKSRPENVADSDLDGVQGGIKDGRIRAAQRPVGDTGVRLQQGRMATDADLNEEGESFQSSAGGSPNV